MAKSKKVLGLKITAPTTYFDASGKKQQEPSVTAFAFVNESTYMDNKISITENEVIDTARQKVGAYLKDIREKKGLSFYAVSKKSGLSIEQVQNIETGNKAYTIDSFFKICRALDCYFFLGNRDGKHLDAADLEAKAKGFGH